MSTVGELVVTLKANTTSLIQGFDKSRSAASTFGVFTGGILKDLAEKFGELAAEAAKAIPELVLHSIDLADELGKASQKAGIAVESMSALEYSAKLADVGVEDFTASMVKFSRSIVESENGNKKAAEAFTYLGIKVKDAQGNFIPTEVLLKQVSEKFSLMEDGAQKTALALDLFSRSGAAMLPFLNQSAAGIERGTEEAKKFGQVISTETAKAAEEFNDNMKALGSALQGVGNALIEGGVLDSLKGLSEWAKNMAANGWISKIATAIKEVAYAIGLIPSTVFVALIDYMGKSANVADQGATSWDKFSSSLEHFRKVSDEVDRKSKLGDVASRAVPSPTLLDIPSFESTKFNRGLNPFELGKPFSRFGEQPKPIDFGAWEVGLTQARQHFADFNKEIEDSVLFNSSRKGADAFKLPENNIDMIGVKIDDVVKKTKNVSDGVVQFTEAIGKGFEDAIVKASSFSDVLKGLAQDLERLLIRSAITGPTGILSGIFNNIAGAVGGLGGGGNKYTNVGLNPTQLKYFSDLTNTLSSTPLGPGRANGGDVMPGNVYPVGENGPELFVPKTAGTIIPNGATGGGGVVHINYNIDAKGAAPGVSSEILQALARVKDDAVKTAVLTMRELQLRRA